MDAVAEPWERLLVLPNLMAKAGCDGCVVTQDEQSLAVTHNGDVFDNPDPNDLAVLFHRGHLRAEAEQVVQMYHSDDISSREPEPEPVPAVRRGPRIWTRRREERGVWR